MTVHLPRWKTILTIVIPIAFVIAMMTIFTLHYVDVKQRDVYPFEQRSDRVSNKRPIDGDMQFCLEF